MRIYNKKSEKEKRKNLRKNMTEEEVILWSVIKNKKLSRVKFRRQYSVGPFIIDFFSVEYKLAIELDGSQHFKEDAIEYDNKRTEYLEALGIKVIRITNKEIRHNLEGVLKYISKEIKIRKTTSPSADADTSP